jgi:hypothetical protein
MGRRGVVLSLVAAAALGWNVTVGAGAARRPVPLRTLAERHVLAVLGYSWSAKRLPQLVNPRTRLPYDNVHVRCAPRGATLFVCAVRPGRSTAPRLYVTARALPGGRFRVHWLRLVRR